MARRSHDQAVWFRSGEKISPPSTVKLPVAPGIASLEYYILFRRGTMIKTILIGTVAAATLAVGITNPAHAENGRNAAAAAGAIGGFALGAAIASQPRTYEPGYYGPRYDYRPVYSHCYNSREWDGFRYRRVRVCD
jgi:hypothetical protein